MTAALASLTGGSVDDVVIPPRVESADDPIDGRAAYVLGTDVLSYHRWDSAREEWAWHHTTDSDELTYWIVDDLASAVAWVWAQRQPAAAGMREREAVEELWVPRWQSLLNTVIPTRPGRAQPAAPVASQRFSSTTRAAAAKPAEAPAPPAPTPPPVEAAGPPPEERRGTDTPWGAGASSGPPPAAFMSEREAWYNSKRARVIVLAVVVVAIAAAVAFVLLRGDDAAPATEVSPSAPTPASSQQGATSAPSAASSSSRPAAPPPAPGEAQQITPPRTATYYPTWYPNSDSGDEATRDRPPPPEPLYTPPVFR